MADKSPSLFRKLTQLFRTGPSIKRRVRSFDSKKASQSSFTVWGLKAFLLLGRLIATLAINSEIQSRKISSYSPHDCQDAAIFPGKTPLDELIGSNLFLNALEII